MSIFNTNSNSNTPNPSEKNIQSNIFIENKWARLSAQIHQKVKMVSTNRVSNSISDVSNKWMKITDKIIPSPTSKLQRLTKRIRSPNIHSTWVEQKKKKNDETAGKQIQ